MCWHACEAFMSLLQTPINIDVAVWLNVCERQVNKECIIGYVRYPSDVHGPAISCEINGRVWSCKEYWHGHAPMCLLFENSRWSGVCVGAIASAVYNVEPRFLWHATECLSCRHGTRRSEYSGSAQNCSNLSATFLRKLVMPFKSACWAQHRSFVMSKRTTIRRLCC